MPGLARKGATVAADVEKLVELAYSAAVQDILWRDWTAELVRQFDTPGALFWVIDANRFDMCQNHMCFRDVDNAQVAQEYLSDHVADDPQMTRVCTQKRSEIYLDTDHVDLSDYRTTAYLAWQEDTVGSRHHITTSVVLSDSLEAGVSLHFSRSQGPASIDVQGQIQSLFPHFCRALQLGFRHAEAVSENWWEGLSSIGPEARLLVGRNGKILRTNAAADGILARGDGLARDHDVLVCDDCGSDAQLAAAVAQVCRSAGAKGSSVPVRRKGGRAAYLISLYPLVQRRRFLAPYGATALICITDPAARFEALSPQQAAMLRLTKREAEIARLLVNGHSLPSAAEMLEISYNTARVHLSSLFAKTNTTRQSELMLFLQRLQ